MAVVSKVLKFFEDGVDKGKDSKTFELLFTSVSVTADGNDNGMTIKEVAGEFDFNAKNITNVGTVDGVDISAHASRHITAGADEIDGDQLDIDFTPSNYTPTTAPAEATDLDHLSAHLAGIDTAIGAASTADVNVKVSANDTTTKYLEDAIVVAQGSNTTNILELSTLNDAGDEDLQIQIDEAKISHDNLLGFVANEHIDHSSVSMNTVADSGLAGGGDLTTSRSLSVDIDGTTGITVIADADTMLVDDGDAGVNRKITRANFLGSAAFSMQSNKITSLADGTASGDAVNRGQLDSAIAGIDLKEAVRVATTAALPAVTVGGSGVGKTLTADAVGVVTLDGEDLTAANSYAIGDRILVKNQAILADNGIYTITTLSAAGAALVLTRATDADEDAEVTNGMFCFVKEGTVQANTGWAVITSDPIVVDTNDQEFSQFQGLPTYTASLGVELSTNDFRLDLLASGGLKLTGNEVGVEPADFAGFGLEDDGADNLRVLANITETATSEASAILVAAGGVSISVDDSTLEGSGQGAAGAESLRVKDLGITTAKIAADAVDRTKIAADVAGDGLGQAAGGELDVNAGDGIQILSDAVAADYTETATNNTGVTIAAGAVVYIKDVAGSAEIELADADTVASDELIVGVAVASILNTASGAVYVRQGATVTPTGGGAFTIGKLVYISATAGSSTQTAPSAVGQHVYKLGRAISTTQVKLQQEHMIELT
jgi:hypothetical protein